MRNVILIIVAFLAVTVLGGCRPYRVDVQQGNVLDQKTVAKIHVGMAKNEVERLLGTPVLVDVFRSDTLIYAYTKQVNGGVTTKKLLVIECKNGRVVQIR